MLLSNPYMMKNRRHTAAGLYSAALVTMPLLNVPCAACDYFSPTATCSAIKLFDEGKSLRIIMFGIPESLERE